jgi:hypothetical protein
MLNDEGSRHSRNAAMLCLWCLPSGMSLVLFFLSLGKIRPILALVCQRLPCVGFVIVLSLRLRYSFVSLSYPAKPLSRFVKIVGS